MKNSLLAMLPDAVMQRIRQDLQVISAAPGDVLVDPGEVITDIYFPLDMVVSLDSVVSENTDDPGAAPGAALTGSEGVISLEPFLGTETSITRATIRIGGEAIRLNADALREEFARTGAFHRLVLLSADALFAQISAIAACERVHPVQQRLVRWLLLLDDRAPLQDLGITQESISQLMGVRRASVSAAASQLQVIGLIAYRRGNIMILDRVGLEARSCKCYREIKARYDAYLRPD